MRINNVEFNAELLDIITELQNQLHINHIPLIHKITATKDNVMITCPYHKDGQERRPSAGIKASDGTFHCLACGEVHELTEVISNCFGYNDGGVFGYKWLCKNFLTFSTETRKDIELSLSRTESKPLEEKFVSEEELDKYRYTHPYMYKRKLNDETIERFDIGYDKETNCITFPIRDERGNTLFVARRSVNSKYFNYPASVRKPLYGIYELSQLKEYPKEVAVCESMLDALAIWSWGGYAVAMNGLGTEYQYEQLRNLPCRELILATDNDSAGRKARVNLHHAIKNKLIADYEIPECKKDINDLTFDEFKSMKKFYYYQ